MANQVSIDNIDVIYTNYKLSSFTLPIIIFDLTFSDDVEIGDTILLDYNDNTPIMAAYESIRISNQIVFGGFFTSSYDVNYMQPIIDVQPTVLTDTSNGLSFSITSAGSGPNPYYRYYAVAVTLSGERVSIGGSAGGGQSASDSSPIIFLRDKNTQKFIRYTSATGSLPSASILSALKNYSVNNNILLASVGGESIARGTNRDGIINITDLFDNNSIEIPGADPYNPGGTSGTGGGGGTFDLTSDTVDFPSLPTLSAVSTGLVSVYVPTLTQLNSLASYMWNANPTDVDWWKKLVANPLDLILGLSIVPVAVPGAGAQNVRVGLIDTGISITKAATQFVEVDCGSIEVKEFWGSALDYSPFRRFSIYLPFIGTRTISTDDIMGKTVHVKYHVDILSGALTALVKVGAAVLYQYSGACAVSLPLTGQTFTDVITSTIQLAAAGVGAVALGATALTGGAAVAAAAGGGAMLANNVMGAKPHIERAGGVSGAAGQLGVMTPYLIGEVPRQSVPENYNTFAGYPANIKSKLGELTGFTSIEDIHFINVSATDSEKDELFQILKDGVIL